MGQTLSREVPVVPTETTLLFVDVQNYCAHRDGSEWKGLAGAEREARLSYFFEQLETHVVPNMQRLQTACRRAGVEVMYTVIQSLTRDGRDRSLDYKITGFNVPPRLLGRQGDRRHSARRGRDRDPEDLVQRVHLDQYRLCPAQPRHALPDPERRGDGPVHRSPRRATPAISATS